MQEASARLDRWYHSQDTPIESTFSPDVAIIRHVTDFVTGSQTTRCFTYADLRNQTQSFFGRERSKHVLGETNVPQHYLGMTQCYEVTRDSEGQAWRQSSIRIRVFDPLDNYKLKVSPVCLEISSRISALSAIGHSQEFDLHLPIGDMWPNDWSHTCVGSKACGNGHARIRGSWTDGRVVNKSGAIAIDRPDTTKPCAAAISCCD